MMFGSHFSDWNYTDNILRAPLCTTTGLASVYSGYPFWLLHRMALGGTAGESARLTQNNGFLDVPDDITTWWGPAVFYQPQTSKAGGCHITLMGDPTLRLHAVKPVTNVAAVNGTDSVALNWIASADPVVGYHVYRSTNANGPFTRITSNVVASTSFTDATVTAGTNTYMVRAIKLEISAGGTYYNSSQGVFLTTTYVPRPAPPSNLRATAADAAVALNWTASAGTASYNVKRATFSGGPFADVATGVTATNYLDTGLTNGTTFFYVVAAVVNGEEGANSSEASATPRSAFQSWQMTYFDSTASAEAAAAADPDRDGMNNQQEYLAGTHPTDPSSKLRIAAIQLNGDDVMLRVRTVTGKSYRVEWNTDARESFTNLVQDNIPGTDGLVEVTDHAATGSPRRFYRVALQLP
jgi:hypothetical protein